MMTIWKYPIEQGSDMNNIVVSMPKGSSILSLQVQKGVPTIWALVNPKSILETRAFMIVGTGWEMEEPPSGEFIGTFQVSGGDFVLHVFEKVVAQ